MAGDGMSVPKTGADTPIRLQNGNTILPSKFERIGDVLIPKSSYFQFDNISQDGTKTIIFPNSGVKVTIPKGASRKHGSDPIIMDQFSRFYNLPAGSVVKGTTAGEEITIEDSDGVTVDSGAGCDVVVFRNCQGSTADLSTGEKGDINAVTLTGDTKEVSVKYAKKGESEILIQADTPTRLYKVE